MYRYELKVNDITNLETLPSRLSNFISSVLTAVRADRVIVVEESERGFKADYDHSRNKWICYTPIPSGFRSAYKEKFSESFDISGLPITKVGRRISSDSLGI